MSRNIYDLDPKLLILYQQFNLKMGEAKLVFVITSCGRTILEQMALYTMGRLFLSDVNTFRKVAKLLPIEESENHKVTWTLNSKHVTNMFDDDLNNDKSRAWDFALLNKAGQVIWDLKISINQNDIPDYTEAGLIAESLGLKWGGRFNPPDYCHIELP